MGGNTLSRLRCPCADNECSIAPERRADVTGTVRRTVILRRDPMIADPLDVVGPQPVQDAAPTTKRVRQSGSR